MGDKFIKGISNVSVTENGSQGYKSTEDPLVDFNYKIASYRGMSEEEIKDDFDKIIDSGEANVLRFLFYVRDIREGLGERRLFRICLRDLVSHDFKDKQKVLSKICEYIVEYGRIDDLFCLLDEDVDAEIRKVVYNYITRLFFHDLRCSAKKEPISLLAKWLPSENASSKKTRALAKEIAKELGLSSKIYRKSVATLRERLNVVERQMSSNRWGEINYNRVPSKANLNYRNAFMRHDGNRRLKYLLDLENGAEGVKMNSSINFPYEIVHKYRMLLGGEGVDPSLEIAWKNLKEIPGLNDCLVVADDSYSMTCSIPGCHEVMAMDVARSIAIYGAQHLRGEYHNKIVTFSEAPKFLDISEEKTLFDILKYLRKHSEAENTNVKAVFDLVLSVAIENNLKQEDLPKTILIISDMEFDGCTTNNNSYLSIQNNPIKAAQREFASAGYKLPSLVFWNVNSRSCVIPIKENDLGVLLVSGFSQNIFRMVADGGFNSRKILDNILNSDRYSKIEKICVESVDRS